MSSPLSLTPNRRVWVGRVLACSAALLIGGCGGGPNFKARGMVKGKVTTGKKLLTTGSVTFVNAEGVSGTASIDVDGNYEMPDAPIGDCKVTVTVQPLPMDPSVRARLKGGGPKMPEGPRPPDGSDGPTAPSPPLAKVPKEIVLIDSKYSKAETSGLTFTVKKGEQTYNIEL